MPGPETALERSVDRLKNWLSRSDPRHMARSMRTIGLLLCLVLLAGIDIGSRWKWDLTDAFGMFFQMHFGIQRWVFSGDIQDLFGGLKLPFWPSAGLHFGVYL